MRAGTLLRLCAALFAGVLFGFGLALSGMVNPARVIGFLDVASGHWDPSLMFVFIGALLVAVPGVMIQSRLARPLLGEQFHVPQRTTIDLRLVGGAALFGIGWGLGGFCPGPAVSALSVGLAPVFLFVVAMAAGMLAHDRFA